MRKGRKRERERQMKVFNHILEKPITFTGFHFSAGNAIHYDAGKKNSADHRIYFFRGYELLFNLRKNSIRALLADNKYFSKVISCIYFCLQIRNDFLHNKHFL